MVNDKGVIVERIPSTWAYLVRHYPLNREGWGPGRFFRVVQGAEIAGHWCFYASMSDLEYDEQELTRNAPQHAQHSEQVN